MNFLMKMRRKYSEMPLPLKASIWFVVCSFLQRGISVITTPIFTRLLTPGEFGEYNVFNSWLGIASVIISLNLYQGVYSQGLVKFEDDRSRFSSALQGLTLVLISCWTVFYACFHDLINRTLSLTTSQVVCMLLLVWMTSVFNFWAVDKRVDYKYRALVLITLASSLTAPILGIILVSIFDDKVLGRILGIVIANLALYSWMFFCQMARGRTFFSKKYWKYALVFNLPLVPHYLSLTLLNSADRIMIANMVGEWEAGIYSLAYSISQIMLIFNTSITQALEPWMYRKIKSEQFEDIARIGYLCLIVVGVLNTLVVALAPEIVALFAPMEYSGAVWVIPPVSLSVLFMFAYGLFAVFEFYFEKTKLVAGATLVGAVVNVLVNLMLIPAFGYLASCYVTLLCYVLLAFFHYIAMSRILKHQQVEVVYSIRSLCFIFMLFTGACALLLLSYHYLMMRVCIISGILLACLVKKGKILSAVKAIISLKNDR